jgi:hypothetical protein
MHPRRRIGIIVILVMGFGIGLFIKNVKTGLVIGLALGLLAGGMISGNGKK